MQSTLEAVGPSFSYTAIGFCLTGVPLLPAYLVD
jgi:hypothetical protein